jgi:cysteine desulfurase
MGEEAVRTAAFRDRLWNRLREDLDSIRLNGDSEQRLPGNLNVRFLGVESSALILALPDVALSAGSACTSATPEPTHVLRALGLPAEEALASIRIGVGRFTTEAEIDRAAERIVAEVRRLRELEKRELP